MSRPVLFCYDGSDGSKTAVSAAGQLIKPGDAVVLVVWTPAAVQLSRAGSFLVAIPNEGEIDQQEAAAARTIAEEGAALAREHGYNASARIAQANESVAKTIDEIAHEIDAGLVVCGQRGRGIIGSALLGSVSHALAAHTKRPLLIAPQHPS
ncbi:MAG TPA: universal stress protein [Solirubrobacteraceae bacterium]|nr:universal stress protein [Solirubrobacteraceae bacterium]